jgi:hypothetical protein
MGYSARDLYLGAYRIYWFGCFVSLATNPYKGSLHGPDRL